MEPSYPQHQTFAPLLGERFELQYAGGETLSAELIEARPLGKAWLEGGRAPFSLLFKGPSAPALPQQIFRLAHPALQALDVFLVPVEAHADGVRYEAVFN
nr:hypothetical protein [uncultured Roseateles sp.]